jgi:6-phosphogluconolactonase
MKSFILICSVLLSLGTYAQQRKEIIYVGTYSIRESKGIYVFELNRSNGGLKLIQTVEGLESPTYLEIHPSRKFLYSVNRGGISKGEPFGSVTAYAIDSSTGKLTFINHVSSFGKDPCHITFDKSGDWAFISNYSEGNFVVLPIFDDGSLGAPSDSKKYFGRSANRLRQDQPHIHSAQVSPDNRFVYVSDLGTDKIYTYSIDSSNGKIIPAEKSEVNVSPGAGPRHFTIHPAGTFAYSAQELTSTVGVFQVDRNNGTLKLLQDTVRSLPKEIKDVNTSADIHTDPTGKFLYVSNRGYDGISIFSIRPDGTIELAGHEKTMGKTPRNFLIDSRGKYLWAANQNTDNVSVFRINPATGKLTFTKVQIHVPSPVCLKQLSLGK